jgi:integrase
MAGQGTIYKRPNSRFWWIAYCRNGRQYQESSKSEKRADAQKLLNARLGEIATGVFHGLRHERVTFDQLAADLLTDYRINGMRSLDKAGRSVRHLQRLFGGMRAMDITTDRVKSYIRQRQEAGVSNGEINRELAALKRMFNLALQQTPPKVRHKPYIPMLKEARPRTGFFEEQDYETLRAALPTYLRPVVTFAYASGWRKREVLGLTWDRVDLKAGTARLDVGTTKGGEGRTFYLTDELQAMLTEVRRLEPFVPWVFTRNGQPIRDFRHAWASAFKRATVEGKTLEGKLFHDFRRTAVREMVRSGVPEGVAMKVSGHKTRSVFERYNILSEEDLRDASRWVERYHAQEL